jgi:hypothetical protein
MRIFKIIIFTFSLVVSCALPEQPKHSMREKEYFKQLEEECGCRLYRSIDSSVLKYKDSGYVGSYYIIFEGVPCSSLLNDDSLRSVSSRVANHLFHYVLVGDSVFPFNSITVQFTCEVAKDTYKSRYYDFRVEDISSN